MIFLPMSQWESVGFVPTSPEVIAEAEAREGVTYEEATGLPRPTTAEVVDIPTLADRLASLTNAVDQLILDSLGGF